MAETTIKARIQCKIEIPVGSWAGGMTDLDALTEQIRKEGANLVQNLVNQKGGVLIGQPRVFMVILSESMTE